ncbi:zinc finger and BTB domain-containing protein 17-like isoform X5 [Euwallacea similis]|uniref:zinc finger and BTB domain-containing protein 17-like isoform X5 n=1 Tax=Euwallacea similis TaxID=1736056 RepID=UPI00344F9B98
MDNPGEILRLCRLCLVKDQVNIPIFEEQGDIRQTFLKIRSCLPVKVSRDDKLPKKICGGCSNKLDLFYEFWSSTANSEKTLQSWLGQEEEDDKMQEITKPVEALVKEESEALEDGHAHDQSFDEATKDEAEAPPAKRARRTAAVKAQINISHDSDEDEDVDGAEPITKIEDESDDSDGEEKDPSYTEVPGTSADDQAGPSGLGKDGVEAPYAGIDTFQDGLEDLFDAGLIVVDSDSTNDQLQIERELGLLSGKKKIIIKGTLYCEICGLPCAAYEDYEKHLFSDPENHTFNCYICDKSFKDYNEMCLHGKTEHGDEQTFLDAEKKAQRKVYCYFCGILETDMGVLKKHIKETHPGFAFSCPSCLFIFKSPRSMFYHRGSDSLVNNVDLVCSKCSLHFYEPISFKKHMTLIHKMEQSEWSYQCILCPDNIKEIEDYRRHIHEHCIFKKPAPISDGVVIQNGLPLIRVFRRQCLLCAKIVLDKTLFEHFTESHVQGNKCPICGLKCKPSSLMSHLEKYNIPCRDKRFVCNEKSKKVVPCSKINIDPSKENMDECWTCHCLVKKKKFANHIKHHKEKGTRVYLHPQHKKNKLQTYKCIKCRQCNLNVFSIKKHLRVHDTERIPQRNKTKSIPGKDINKTSRRENQKFYSPPRYTQGPRDTYRPPERQQDRYESDRFQEYYERHRSISRERTTSPRGNSSSSRARRSSSRGRRSSSRDRFDTSHPSRKRQRDDRSSLRDHFSSGDRYPSRTREQGNMKCTDCSKVFDSLENLVNHMKVEHFGLGHPHQHSFANHMMMAQTRMMQFQGLQQMMGPRIGQGRPHWRMMQPFGQMSYQQGGTGPSAPAFN